jgi:hypothetical protein
MGMDELLKLIKEKPHVAVLVPAILCFVQFITNLFTALSDGHIDNNELHQLLASADGFETVFLLIIVMVLKGKQK